MVISSSGTPPVREEIAADYHMAQRMSGRLTRQLDEANSLRIGNLHLGGKRIHDVTELDKMLQVGRP